MYLLESDVTPWEQAFRLGLPGWVGNHDEEEREGVYRGSAVHGDERDLVYYSEATSNL